MADSEIPRRQRRAGSPRENPDAGLRRLLGGLLAACLLSLPLVWAGQGSVSRDDRAVGTEPDAANPGGKVEASPSAAEFGFAVTGGAAPGYLEDQVCALCHGEIFESYQEVGMARSFARPQNAESIEDFTAEPFYHRPSNRYYSMRREPDGGLVMARWQRGEEGGQESQRVSYIEQEVDWVLGSGHTSRVYLFRTPSGELYQLPLAWYSQGQGWGMAPGYDWPVHEGVSRRVRRECMFCHNAYPDVPADSDFYGAPQVFPAQLPEGTGCQRCHGPGAEHVARFFDGGYGVDEIRRAIVNPGNLATDLELDICYGCHMQPTVELMGVRRFGRSDYSLRPGEPLGEYLVLLDAEAADQAREERFEINHHPYRLEQSRCFQGSVEGGAPLTCLTCHDPHRKVPVADRAEHYRRACLSCHELESCAAQGKGPGHGGKTLGETLGGVDLNGGDLGGVDPGNCVACHMPRRRTQDVIHVAMTDHKIQKYPGDEDLLAALEERDPVIVGLDFLRPSEAKIADGEIYRTAAVVRAGGGLESADRLESLLLAASSKDLAPWLDLARSRVQQRRWPAARKALDRVSALMPEGHPAAGRLLSWRAMLAVGEGKAEKGIELFRAALELSEDPSAHFNLGVVLAGSQRLEQAEGHLRRAVELRPNSLPPTFYLARVLRALERPRQAIDFLERALAVDPGHGDSYLLLGHLQNEVDGDLEAARSTWRRGLFLARETKELRVALGG